MVSRSIAQKFWPDGSALGKRIVPGRPDGSIPWSTIVGVIDDIKHRGLDVEDPIDFVYLPLLGPVIEASESGPPPQSLDLHGGIAFVVRTSVEPTTLVPALRSELASIDPDIPMSRVQTLEQALRESRAQVSFTVLVLLISALLALSLAGIGLYGVISYIVAQRTREIGVRIALGAQRADVVQQVLRGGAVVSIAGIAIGLALAFATTRTMESLLYGIDKYDPPTFVAVPLVLFAVAMFASWVPAMRAARVEPVHALRSE